MSSGEKKNLASPGDIMLKDDLEKGTLTLQPSSLKEETGEVANSSWLRKFRFASLGAEARGCVPVPLDERTDRKGTHLISLWFTANFSLLPIATGMAGTLAYGLSLRDASLVIIFFCLLAGLPVAWMGMAGPQTGMRQMIQARFYFGFYFVTVIIILQLATITGFTILTGIISGQTLAAISEGTLSLNVGIVITALVGLSVSFMGYKVLHIYEKYSWVPTMIAVLATLGIGGKYLYLQQELVETAAASTIVSFGSIVAAFSISWSCLVSDFAVYVSPEVPKIRIFSYVYAGLVGTSLPLMILGAAIGGAAPNIESWAIGYANYSTGGLIYAVLEPAGGFGKFVAVLLALSVIGNVSCSLYALSISFQTILPILVRVPRFLFSVLIVAIVIPVSIVIANNFYESFNNFLGVIGYWTAIFIGIAIVEYHYFRKGSLDCEIWNVGSKLPMGIAGIATGFLSLGLVIPSMATVWFTGPIAQYTGDIGFELGFVASVIIYIPLRTLEKHFTGR